MSSGNICSIDLVCLADIGVYDFLFNDDMSLISAVGLSLTTALALLCVDAVLRLALRDAATAGLISQLALLSDLYVLIFVIFFCRF